MGGRIGGGGGVGGGEGGGQAMSVLLSWHEKVCFAEFYLLFFVPYLLSFVLIPLSFPFYPSMNRKNIPDVAVL